MNTGFRFSVFGCLLLAIFSGGCATIGEGARCLAGISSKVLEDSRDSAIVQTFALDYFTAYSKASEALKAAGAYFYAHGIDRHMIAFYLSYSDTTPVGVFFEEAGVDRTKVEVSSPSTYAKELIASKLFPALETKNAGTP